MTDRPEREALARILHEQFMMPGHAFPDAPWKDACSESADQLLDYLGRAGLALAALPTPPPSLDAAWAAAEAALPGPDWTILMGDGRDHPGYGYWATASHRDPESRQLTIVGGKRQDGRTSPVEALYFLADRLAREYARSDE